jgi:hypothetical protein
MPGPIPSQKEIQDKLDAWVASDPAIQKYVTKVWYLPDDAEVPPTVTHTVRLAASKDEDLDLRLGVVATLETAAQANAILALLDVDAKKR